MNAQDLKNSILQLAVQGKLVEQRAEEGTARELLEQIKLEKDQLIKDKKIKKSKPLPEITEDEIPFEIPESWEWVFLQEIAYVNGGYAFKSNNYTTEGTRVVRISDFNENGFVNSKIVRHPYSDEFEPFLVNEKDILLCMTGGTVGKSFFVQSLPERMMTNQRVATIKIIGSIQEYVNYVILAPITQNIIRASKTSTNDNISMDTIYSFLIPLPPFEEIKRIVSKIEEILPYIDQYDKAYTKLETFNKKFPEDMKKSILQLAMQGKLVEQRPEEGTADELYEQIVTEKAQLIKDGKIKKEKSLPEITEDEIPFEIPSSWKWVRLGEITFFQGGYAFKSTEYVAQSDNQVIRLGNVKQGRLLTDVKQVFIGDEQAEKAKEYQIKPNDILVTMTGTRRKKDYLYICRVQEEDISERNLFINQRVGCFRTFNYVDIGYLVVALQNDTIRDIIFQKETGTANQGNLGSEDMKKYIYIPLPPLAEQKRIVAKIEELLPYCDQLVK